MTFSSHKAIVACLFLVSGGTSVSSAEPIVPHTAFVSLTSGRISLFASTRGDVELFGNGFTLDLPLANAPAPFGLVTPTVVLPSFETSATGAGTLQLDDRVLHFGGEPGTEFHMRFVITAPPVRTRTPVSSDRPDGDFVVDYPFQLSGELFGRAVGGESVRFHVSGQGTGQAMFRPPDSSLQVDLILNQSAPVPEPGTLLLVAGGAIAAMARSRRRRTGRNIVDADLVA